jgi:flagellar hook protein FlgE
MMRSLFSGLAGMRTQQHYMDVIGNNIANVNTAGYKGARTAFEDLLYTSLRAASAGSNPVQVGAGARVASIDTVFRQGNPQATGSQLDLAIIGEGFLVVSADGRQAYTRSGVLGFDTEGYLVHTATGGRVMGWTADRNGVIPVGRSLTELRVAPGLRAPAAASSDVVFTGLFDARLPVGTTLTRDITVIDSLGREQILTIDFTRTSNETWAWELRNPNSPDAPLAADSITFDDQGRVIGGAVSAPVSFTAVDGLAPRFDFRLDFSACESGGGELSIVADQLGGIGAGTLEDVAIDELGRLVGVFSNGVHRVLGQISLATFANPGGLERISGNMFAATENSGRANTSTAPGDGRGKFSPGYLEMSNVDLTEEFTSMILSQRAFQANSRVVTAADELLQEVINLRR